MAVPSPLLAFLRPLGLPCSATVRHFLRFSQNTRSSVEGAVPRESISVSATVPVPSLASTSTSNSPPTKVPKAPSPSEAFESQSQSGLKPTVTTPTQIMLPYHISRTPSAQLPFYLLRKRGGNLHQTRVKGIAGDINVLRTDIQRFLNLPEKEVTINRTTNHIICKGHWRSQLTEWAKQRGF
ncbi:hypothetical protein M501DRAFT_997469 [Patellaria atrata CBS 101060]|uniref:Large ribosomal subunit protein mL49 n=1 Tax=Patellaria atrata CBS 101060 TaxID=1346257 RepID=A0A9P4S4A6_9PEZI|nr:hypothetical protein M501DRAFT_997469 [Patellaria atrata CBS 101060]